MNIETIFVRPRNKYYCEYSINNSKSIHTKTYDDLKDYLFEIIPERVVQINFAIMRFLSFVVYIPEKEFIFLQLDDITDHLSDIIKYPALEQAMADIRIKNKKTSDQKIKDLSEIDINKIWEQKK